VEIKRVVSLLFGLVASEMFHILYFDTPFLSYCYIVCENGFIL
jgi:hypothetical protein